MAKLTQFGRMRRRIKKEAASAKALAWAQSAALVAQTSSYLSKVSSTVVDVKLLKASHAVFVAERIDREEERLP
jgi:hypothetical protein